MINLFSWIQSFITNKIVKHLSESPLMQRLALKTHLHMENLRTEAKMSLTENEPSRHLLGSFGQFWAACRRLVQSSWKGLRERNQDT